MLDYKVGSMNGVGARGPAAWVAYQPKQLVKADGPAQKMDEQFALSQAKCKRSVYGQGKDYLP